MVQTYYLPEAVRSGFVSFLDGFSGETYNPYSDHLAIQDSVSEKLLALLSETASISQSDTDAAHAGEILSLIESVRFGRQYSVFSIQNMPHDQDLPDTPQMLDSFNLVSDGYKAGFISEFSLLAFNNAMGLNVAANPGMQGSLPFQQIIPVPTQKGQTVNSAPEALPMHTETTYNENPPDFISFVGLRKGRGKTLTDIINVQDILSDLDEGVQAALRQGSYVFSAKEGLNEGDRCFIGPVLSEDKKGRLGMRFLDSDHRVGVRGDIDADAQRKAISAYGVLKETVRSIRRSAQNLALEIFPGQGLWLRNGAVLHGRSMDSEALKHSQDVHSDARWITRAYANYDDCALQF